MSILQYISVVAVASNFRCDVYVYINIAELSDACLNL